MVLLSPTPLNQSLHPKETISTWYFLLYLVQEQNLKHLKKQKQIVAKPESNHPDVCKPGPEVVVKAGRVFQPKDHQVPTDDNQV